MRENYTTPEMEIIEFEGGLTPTGNLPVVSIVEEILP